MIYRDDDKFLLHCNKASELKIVRLMFPEVIFLSLAPFVE